VTLYGTEVWAFGSLEQIDRVFCVFIKKLFGLSRYTAHYAIRLEFNYYLLKRQVMKRMLTYWCKILDMSDHRYPRKCYEMLYNSEELGITYRKNWLTWVKDTLNLCGFSFVWSSQDSNLVRQHMENILQVVEDQQRCSDRSRLSLSFAYRHYSNLKNPYPGEPYLQEDKLSLAAKKNIL